MNAALSPDAIARVKGCTPYALGRSAAGMLHVAIVRSPHAHAQIRNISVDAARSSPGVVAVLTGDDIGSHGLLGYDVQDQPFLAAARVRFVGEAVAAVAARSLREAIGAASKVHVDYTVLPTVGDIETALEDHAPDLGNPSWTGGAAALGRGARAEAFPSRNVVYGFEYAFGDRQAWDRCDQIDTDVFTHSSSAHMTLEPFVALAVPEADGRVHIVSSTQSPHTIQLELARVFNRSPEDFVVEAPPIGGGFGAKGTLRLEPLATAFALLTGRPVRVASTLAETMMLVRQHAARIVLKTGYMRDGRLVARSADVTLDAGAYADASPLVVTKAAYRALGPYRWLRGEVRGRAVLTSRSPASGFRGFGGTQATWASESQIDMVARRCCIDPVDMRMGNLRHVGEPYVPGESPLDSDLQHGLRLVTDEIGYGGASAPGEGVGVAVGAKDSGGIRKDVRARVSIDRDAQVTVSTASVDMGQGVRHAMVLVAARALDADPAVIRCTDAGTSRDPFDQGTVASGGASVMAGAVAKAANSLREALARHAGMGAAAVLSLREGSIREGAHDMDLGTLVKRVCAGGPLHAEGATTTAGDPDAPLGGKSFSWEVSWAAARVAVDRSTGAYTVLELVTSGDVGRAIRPAVCHGQEQGAAMMGLGQAQFEALRPQGDAWGNAEPRLYRLAVASDIPNTMRTIIQEQGLGPGPDGAKGAGEGGILVVAAAVANAIDDAVGARVCDLPITPERVWVALQTTHEQGDTNDNS